MSIQAVAWVLDNERETTGATRLVLLALANYANKSGEAWPSVRTLAQDCNCSPRQVQYSLQQLAELGCVTKLERVDDPKIRGDRRPFKYLINGVQPLHLADATGCKSRRNGVQSATSRGEAQFTQTIKEPSKNRVAPFQAKPPMHELRGKVRNGKQRTA